MNHVAVTATRRGITRPQRERLIEQLVIVRNTLGGKPPDFMLHHGDCVGGDHTAWAEARALGWRTCSHPPIVEDRWRAWTRNDQTCTPAPYRDRNQQIVDHVRMWLPHVLIGMPGNGSRYGSGTWQTIEYAQRTDTHTVVILPDGTIE